MPVLISTRSYMLLKIDSGWVRGMWLVIVAMLVLGVVVRRRHYGCSCAYGLWHWHGSVRYGPARSGPVRLSLVQPGSARLVVVVVWTMVAVVLAVVGVACGLWLWLWSRSWTHRSPSSGWHVSTSKNSRARRGSAEDLRISHSPSSRPRDEPLSVGKTTACACQRHSLQSGLGLQITGLRI